MLGLTLWLVRAETVGELLVGALRVGSVPEGIHLPLLLGALAFAGAGGSVNLAQSNYIKDKGYGMGRYIGRITSPLTGRDEAEVELGIVVRNLLDEKARNAVAFNKEDVLLPGRSVFVNLHARF